MTQDAAWKLDESIAKKGGAAAVVAELLGRQPRPLDLHLLAGQQAPARVWRRQGWLGAGPTYLGGPGGSGKSTLVQHEATAGALGRAYFAAECEPYTSLMWNCEDDHDELWRRQENICAHEDIALDAVAGRLHMVSRYGCENALMAPISGQLCSTNIFTDLRDRVNDLGIDVLWLDNAAHLFLGDHDNRTEVTQFINALNGLVRGRPFSVVIVAHPGKAIGSEYSGSVAWENAVRMRWYLGPNLPDQRIGSNDEEESKRSDVRFLAKRKSNYSAQDYVRLTMRDGLLVPDEPASHVGGIVSMLDERRTEELCLAGFHSLCAMGIRTTDGKTSPDYLPSQIASKNLAAGYSKSELGRAMNRLMGRGTFIRAQIGQHTNRSPKFGLVLKEGEQ